MTFSFAAAFTRAGFAPFLSPTTTARFAAAFIGFINGSPGAALRFFLTRAAFFVALFDVLSFAFLFRRVFLFTSSCHKNVALFRLK